MIARHFRYDPTPALIYRYMYTARISMYATFYFKEITQYIERFLTQRRVYIIEFAVRKLQKIITRLHTLRYFFSFYSVLAILFWSSFLVEHTCSDTALKRQDPSLAVVFRYRFSVDRYSSITFLPAMLTCKFRDFRLLAAERLHSRTNGFGRHNPYIVIGRSPHCRKHEKDSLLCRLLFELYY